MKTCFISAVTVALACGAIGYGIGSHTSSSNAFVVTAMTQNMRLVEATVVPEVKGPVKDNIMALTQDIIGLFPAEKVGAAQAILEESFLIKKANICFKHQMPNDLPTFNYC